MAEIFHSNQFIRKWLCEIGPYFVLLTSNSLLGIFGPASQEMPSKFRPGDARLVSHAARQPFLLTSGTYHPILLDCLFEFQSRP